ncbi:phosphoglycerate kinase, partial [Bacillus altitudinis]|uniref:phosphoglycerate kinase n=1 Tax=Bacillus altitudinis TaxID=293387 RepID=UPI003B515C03
KIGLIESLLDKVEKVMIGVGLGYTFVKAVGEEVGKCVLEEEKVDLGKWFMEGGKEKGVKLVIGRDVVVGEEF